jgi:hypothetical protein
MHHKHPMINQPIDISKPPIRIQIVFPSVFMVFLSVLHCPVDKWANQAVTNTERLLAFYNANYCPVQLPA